MKKFFEKDSIWGQSGNKEARSDIHRKGRNQEGHSSMFWNERKMVTELFWEPLSHIQIHQHKRPTSKWNTHEEEWNLHPELYSTPCGHNPLPVVRRKVWWQCLNFKLYLIYCLFPLKKKKKWKDNFSSWVICKTTNSSTKIWKSMTYNILVWETTIGQF